MWWKRKQDREWLPWYRAPDFKGRMTEGEKRQLDSFRMRERHPAASYLDLPEEVQSYIIRIELENYDLKQGNAASGALFLSGVGAAMLCVNYFGVHVQPAESFWSYAVALFFLIVPWFRHSWQWKRNANEFRPRGVPIPTDEHIKQEWELDYLTRLDQKDGSKHDL
ncbi:hypothetical protein AMC83_PA00055 (plasmid) [Rhizobium phaseoli]|uniref:hypothetical protein n=1 Tax=Rhizobium phaseoli TaxID=396 RepID=UPI0007EC1AE2|nr:hypothetical protein [Rhizobium phaseoli]ANL74282.1 hypothetical protein AMC83_PA00055 [Rhizobium phaseoli]